MELIWLGENYLCRVRVLNGTFLHNVYADDVNNGRKRTCYEKNTEALVVASKETGPEINSDKTKYMIMCRDQNARRSHARNIENNFFEIVEQFKYRNNPKE
jgi:hypothetical protein